MTQEQILQGNRLIAEHLGWRFVLDDGLIHAYFGEDKRWIDSPEFLDELLLSPHGFCFNTDWNKLMPVVEKILFFTPGFHSNLDAEIHSALSSVQISEVFKSVVKFIQWYNSLPAAQECDTAKA